MNPLVAAGGPPINFKAEKQTAFSFDAEWGQEVASAIWGGSTILLLLRQEDAPFRR
jgi:hypothetical protein